MVRLLPLEVALSYRIKFGTVIFKDTWSPAIGQQLTCHPDQYKGNALGMYHEIGNLVDHMPMELSCLLTNFINAETDNEITAAVSGK